VNKRNVLFCFDNHTASIRKIKIVMNRNMLCDVLPAENGKALTGAPGARGASSVVVHAAQKSLELKPRSASADPRTSRPMFSQVFDLIANGSKRDWSEAGRGANFTDPAVLVRGEDGPEFVEMLQQAYRSFSLFQKAALAATVASTIHHVQNASSNPDRSCVRDNQQVQSSASATTRLLPVEPAAQVLSVEPAASGKEYIIISFSKFLNTTTWESRIRSVCEAEV
jgi:hypothetical protein